MKKHLISIILLALLMSTVSIKVFASDIALKNEDGITIYYNIVNNKTELTVTFCGSSPSGYQDRYTGNVVIPESVTYAGTTYSVTNIGNKAFYICRGLTSVTIPKSVTSIGISAFSGCSGLTNVTISDGVTNIDQNAFESCTSLTSFTIPKSVTNIGSSAFYNCTNLLNITISESVTNIGSNAFGGCYRLKNVIIPNSVTKIGNGAFYYCSDLSCVTIGKSITNIGNEVFSYCNSLKDVCCLSENPPSTGDDIFLESSVNEATLHVPESAIEDYSALSPWNMFGNIVTLPKYNLTYIVAGETYKTYAYEEGKSVPTETEPEKEGHTFSGWSEIPEFMPAHDVEVSGSFTINTYKLTYMVDGVEYKTADLEYGGTIAPEVAPKKEGFKFVEWDGLPEMMPAHDVTVTASYIQFLGKCATPTIAFKDGKFKFESEEEGVEFVWNISVVGNSGKGSEVGTPKKYILSVCATKEFYEDSEPATMEMGMSSPIGDVNGDGVVNAADIATLVDIILHM